MLADASDGVASLGPLIKFGVTAFVVLAILAVFIEGSSAKIIRRIHEQRKSEPARTEAEHVTGSDKT